jgi:hypothetical protein
MQMVAGVDDFGVMLPDRRVDTFLANMAASLDSGLRWQRDQRRQDIL